MTNLPALLTELEKLSREATAGLWQSGEVGAWGGEGFYLSWGPQVKECVITKDTSSIGSVNVKLLEISRNSIDLLIRFCREALEVSRFYEDENRYNYSAMRGYASSVPEDRGLLAREFRKRWGIVE